ncbi:MAG: FUSC family protein [Variovorax sp.]
MPFDAVVHRLGFPPRQLYYALRTAIGACIALLLAWALGLEHPQWAAMSVWIASQPTRGMLLEKSLFRALGTVVGTMFGVALVMVSGDKPWILVLGLAVWVSACAGTGNVWRGYASYGAILAGYSAAMVSLLDSAHPEKIVALGMDRFFTVMLGIAVAVVIGWLFSSVQHLDALRERMRLLTVRVLRDLATRLSGELHAGDTEHREVLSEIASIEDLLDPHAFGSLRSRKAARALRQVLLAQVSALLWMRSESGVVHAQELSQALVECAGELERGSDCEVVLRHLRRALLCARGDAALSEVLQRLQTALARASTQEAGDEHPLRVFESRALHRDWAGGQQVALRALVVLLLVGGFWVITGWKPGAYTLLGTTVMLSLFSTFDNPALVMRPVIAGHVVGLSAALLCRWLMWPWAGSQLELLYLMMPFIFLGALVLAHPRTAPIGFDYNFLLLIMLQPSYPLRGEVSASLMSAVAMLAAPCLALLAYRYIFPNSTAQRAQAIMRMMLAEVQAMAADPAGVAHQGIWRARLYHRLIRLIRLSDKGAGMSLPTLDYCLNILQLGSLVLHLRAWMESAAVDAAAVRRLQSTLRRLARLQADPRPAMNALRRLAAGSHARQLPQPELLLQALKGCVALESAGYLSAVPPVFSGKAVRH